MKIAYIEWEDARGIGGRINKPQAEKEGLLLVKTAGILVREDAEVIAVCQDYWTYEDGDGTKPEEVRELEIIPRVMVRRLEIVEYTQRVLGWT